MKRLSARSRREITRFLKFCVVGVIGAVVDFGSFNLLANVLGIWSVAASMLSFSAAVVSNFLWNRYWTYPDSRSKNITSQAVQFGLVSLIGLAIRTPLYALSEATFIRLASGWLPQIQETFDIFSRVLDQIPAVVVGRNLALALAVIVVLFWNFGINRVWTYSDVE
ncbi:MAG: GtrA family protein [Anaerolineales bacterium]|nr:GtrA family protein [Anaerolineales bacterium]